MGDSGGDPSGGDCFPSLSAGTLERLTGTHPAFPSPRSWEFVSRILDSLDSQLNPSIEHEIIAGAVGTGAATELTCLPQDMFGSCPTLTPFCWTPSRNPSPERGRAVCSRFRASSVRLRHQLLPHCLYLNRLPTEFRVLCVRDATLRAPAIRCTAGYTKWAIENHHAIA